jgi:hypothetical protein
MALKIIIETQPVDRMRYKTLGDYYDEDGIQAIMVADCGDDDYNFAVALHEFVEAYLTKKNGIKEEAITDFDKKFEAEWKNGDPFEPGDSPLAPYRKEHAFATTIERMFLHECGRNFYDYDMALNDFFDANFED